MNGIEIGNLNQLNWLWLVAAIAVIVALAIRRQRRALGSFATPNLRARVLPHASAWRPVVLASMSLAAMALLALCLLDIRWGRVTREVPQQGIEVVFVLDVSRSMLAQDVTPNRLERAKQQIKDMIDVMAGDRVALVVFAGEVRHEIPLTSHYGDFKQRLDEVSPQSVDRGGSRLGDAIRVASDAFLGKTHQHKAMVLLTDGEDMESEPIAAARAAKEKQGIRIYTIGLGDFDRGAPIPADSRVGPKYVQHQGQPVLSKLNGQILQAVATETGGAYIPAGTKQVDMAGVYHGYLTNVGQREFATARIDAYQARFPWFLAPAVALLIAEVIIQCRRPKGTAQRTG